MAKSNSGSSSASAGGVSGVGVVQIVFLILKLCKIAPIGDWPWWKVMLPLECSVGLICCIGCCGAGCGLIVLCNSKDDKVAKPGIVLTEDQLRMYEKSLENITNVTEKRDSNSVDSQATTSPTRHYSKQSSLDGNIGIIVEENSDNNV